MDVAAYYELQGQNVKSEDSLMIPKEVQELSLEQSLDLRIIADKTKEMHRDQMRDHILWLTKMLFVKQNMIRHFMAKELKVKAKK